MESYKALDTNAAMDLFPPDDEKDPLAAYEVISIVQDTDPEGSITITVEQWCRFIYTLGRVFHETGYQEGIASLLGAALVGEGEGEAEIPMGIFGIPQ